MRKRKEFPSEAPNWLDTYADMVTLMLTFFVLLFAFSTMNAGKWEKLVKAFQTVNGKEPPASAVAAASTPGSGTVSLPSAPPAVSKPSSAENANTGPVTKVTKFDDLYPYFKQYVTKNNLQSQIGLYRGKGFTFLSFQNSIFFQGDSSALQPSATKILDFICNAMTGIPNEIGEIRFYGHTAKISATDTLQKQAFDRGLSDQRAINVLLYVQQKGVINGNKMVSEGFGEYRPIVEDDGTEGTRAENRRVEIYIAKSGSESDELAEVYSQINAQKQQEAGSASGTDASAASP